MKFDVSFYSATGDRTNNEDAVAVKKHGSALVAVCADGLGGHDNGEIASKKAVNCILKALRHQPISKTVLEHGIETANLAVLERARGSEMKTTVSVVWFDGDKALIATVGDTRVYVFRDNEILFQSIDHSVSQISVMAGEITADEIRGHKDRNKLVRVLGNKENVKSDITEYTPKSGDALLLCSDGFWENVVEDKMLASLSFSRRAKDWLRVMRLAHDANPDGDFDNHSAITLLIR